MKPTLESKRLLDRAIDKSKRSQGIQLPPGFVRDDADGEPPLAKMVRGGRGGEVRLKLYLTMTLVAVHKPYDIKSLPGRPWAEMLGLPDPARNGARRIGDALDWLEKADLVKIKRHPGLPPTVALRHPDGTGTRYSWRGGRYIGLPLGFWRNRWIYRLSSTGVALLLVLREMCGGRSESSPPWLTGDQRKRYGLSDDTWTRATQELVKHGLLTVGRTPQGGDFDYRRMRNTYWLHIDRLTEPMSEDAEVV